MYDRNRNRKSDPKSTVISLLVIALFLLPVEITATLILLALFFFPLFLLFRNARKNNASHANKPRKESTEAFDDCPKPFCFHKDKGEHHLRKGREMDPWDRPDIDISKYQRK